MYPVQFTFFRDVNRLIATNCPKSTEGTTTVGSKLKGK